MKFLNPLWFFGLFSLAIPILIHLIHQNQGKVFKVGSLILWNDSPRKGQNALKLRDWWLLCLRCCLFILLTLILAEMIWPNTMKKNQASWVLLPQENRSAIYSSFKKSIDSLILTGAEPHQMDSEFTRINSLFAPAKIVDSLEQNKILRQNYFESAKRLEGFLPRGSKAYFFTDNLKMHFEGDLSTVSYPAKWTLWKGKEDSIHSWVKAWKAKNQTIQGIGYRSNKNGTGFFTRELDKREIKTLSIPLDTSVFSIAILYDNQSQDHSFLESAIRTGLSYLPEKTELEIFQRPDEIKKPYSWIFWIKESPVPPTLLKLSKNLFQYGLGKDTGLHSFIVNSSFNPNTLGLYPIPLYKSISITPKLRQEFLNSIIWEDGRGSPILIRDTSSQKTVLTFYSRFNPNWNDLVWSESFPLWIIDLLSKSQTPLTNKTHDWRQIFGEIPMTKTSFHDTPPTKPEIANTDLPIYLGLLFILLFLVERFLSHIR